MLQPGMSIPQIAIVTGGSRGIGAAIAKSLGANGYSVAVNFAADRTAAEHIVEELAAAGAKAVAIQGDVSSEDDVLSLFETAERQLGPLTALINNAGITGGFSRVDSVDAAALARMLSANVTGAIICAREAVRRMSTRSGGGGGAIVNVSSLAARTGGAEVANEGIRVNAVAPGLIETDLHAANGVPDRPQRLSPTIPMQRPGTAGEVANGVLWLLSNAASYVTGTILEVGGGR
jgi:NAD(P)-dependent dehydrogenase (short-subunit alcohol dehydrogenase family)